MQVLFAILGKTVLRVLALVSHVTNIDDSARIPQIIKNYREKSCDGLSLLFFLLSLMGNLTYGAGVSCIGWTTAYTSLTPGLDYLPLC